MVREFIGKPLLDYLNERNKIKFTGIKVVNDTIASLFAGLTDNSYDAYIGLIVGTGTNMATFIPADKIEKLDQSCKWIDSCQFGIRQFPSALSDCGR